MRKTESGKKKNYGGQANQTGNGVRTIVKKSAESDSTPYDQTERFDLSENGPDQKKKRPSKRMLSRMKTVMTMIFTRLMIFTLNRQLDRYCR